MINCKQASQLISQSLDRRLTWRERFILRLHLCICDNCARFKKLLNRLAFAVKQRILTIENDTSITLPSASKARMAEAIRRLPE